MTYDHVYALKPTHFQRQNGDSRNEPKIDLRTVTAVLKRHFAKRTHPCPSHCHFGTRKAFCETNPTLLFALSPGHKKGVLRNEPSSSRRTGTSEIGQNEPAELGDSICRVSGSRAGFAGKRFGLAFSQWDEIAKDCDEQSRENTQNSRNMSDDKPSRVPVRR
jgi:hypothetical protein